MRLSLWTLYNPPCNKVSCRYFIIKKGTCKKQLHRCANHGNNMRILKFISIFLVLAVAGIYFFSRSADDKRQVFKGNIFGTYYKIIINSEQKKPGLENDIKQVLQQVNSQMSVFEPHSEISQINQTGANVKIKLSEPMRRLIKTAAQIYQESNHSFDPTVGRLVEAWGFGTKNNPPAPSPERIREILQYTGFDKLSFSPDFQILQKADGRTFLNLSAIAKGYAVDRIADLLEMHDYHNYLVEIGGEMRISGQGHAKEEGWNVGIAVPAPKSKDNTLVLTVSDTAVATSGDYRNFSYYNGEKISHTISPANGYPVIDRLASATVFHSECMLADAYATAIMALGEKAGMQLADDLGLKAILILHQPEEGQFQVRYSQAASVLQEQ